MSFTQEVKLIPSKFGTNEIYSVCWSLTLTCHSSMSHFYVLVSTSLWLFFLLPAFFFELLFWQVGGLMPAVSPTWMESTTQSVTTSGSSTASSGITSEALATPCVPPPWWCDPMTSNDAPQPSDQPVSRWCDRPVHRLYGATTPLLTEPVGSTVVQTWL